ncbi:hypothetical protein [Ferrimonas marina]|nr:hypothetical protein [Ferrimonas marina]
MTFNGSVMDEMGWDYLVEYYGDASAEIHDRCRQFKVQVKASSELKGSIPIKVSNLHALASDPLPAFIAVMRIGDSRQVDLAYLLHIDSELVSKILERSMGLEVAGKPLNKSTLSLPLVESDRLSEVGGDCFKGVVERAVGPSFSDYVKAKQQWCSQAGFEEGSASVELKVEGEEFCAQLVEMTLGHHREIRFSGSEMSKVRFGHKYESQGKGPGVLSMGRVAPSGHGTVKLKCGYSPMSVPADLYVSTIAGADRLAYRIDGHFFELESNPARGSTGQGSFTVKGDNSVLTLQQLKTAVRFTSRLCAGQRKLSFRGGKGGEAISFDLDLASDPVDFSHCTARLDAYQIILDQADVDMEPRFSLDDAFGQSVLPAAVAELLSGDGREIKCSFSVDGQASTRFVGKRVNCIHRSSCDFGTAELVVVFVVTGIAEQDGASGLVVKDRRAQLLACLVRSEVSGAVLEELKAVVSERMADLSGDLVVDGDLQSWTEQDGEQAAAVG